MIGIIPSAGLGSRLQPLGFSKELLPVGTRFDGGIQKPKAVGEYLMDRMVAAGADRICMVISPLKTDILRYFGADYEGASLAYVVQPRPSGLCDAIFRALPLIRSDEDVLVGLPDTIWFPETGYRSLPDGEASFLLFPVDHPEQFDAVVTDRARRVLEIQVKQPGVETSWVWGAFKMPGETLKTLGELWLERDRSDEYFGTLFNAWLARGGDAVGVRSGTCYLDTGTFEGFRQATRTLGAPDPVAPEPPLFE